MIEKAFMEYLMSIPDLYTMVGGKIYYRQAPSTVQYPWVVITNSGGMRKKETQVDFYSSATDTLTLYVDDNDLFRGKQIADRIVQAVENFRGIFQGYPDTWIRCGTVRDLTGWQGSFRQLLTIYIQYRIDTNVPS